MEAPLMPREMLFASATRRDPQLSPSGELLAFVAPLPDGAPNLWVATPAMDDARPVTRSERGIGAFGWTGADRYLFYVADRNGDENTHVHLVNVTDGTERDLTPFPNVQAGVLAVEHGLPGTILLDMDRRSPGRPEPYRADLATGELTLAAENIDALGFVADSRLAARGMVTLAADGAVALHVRETEAGPWREVYRVGQPDAG